MSLNRAAGRQVPVGLQVLDHGDELHAAAGEAPGAAAADDLPVVHRSGVAQVPGIGRDAVRPAKLDARLYRGGAVAGRLVLYVVLDLDLFAPTVQIDQEARLYPGAGVAGNGFIDGRDDVGEVVHRLGVVVLLGVGDKPTGACWSQIGRHVPARAAGRGQRLSFRGDAIPARYAIIDVGVIAIAFSEIRARGVRPARWTAACPDGCGACAMSERAPRKNRQRDE